jgi:hypothetical protein
VGNFFPIAGDPNPSPLLPFTFSPSELRQSVSSLSKIKRSIISLLGSAELTGVWVVWVWRNSPAFGWFGSDCDGFITVRDTRNQGKPQDPPPYYFCFAKISVHRLLSLWVNVLVWLLVFVFCPENSYSEKASFEC